MSPGSLKKITLALRDTKPWPLMTRRLRALSGAELDQAESAERLGKRRQNLLLALKGERYRRAGKPEKMLRLKVEGKI
jgi:hypothetical protein